MIKINYERGFKYLFIFCLALIMLMIGSLFNYLTVTENSCLMPVKLNYYLESNTHMSFLDKSEINFYYFSDIFRLGSMYFSIGDVLMMIAVAAVTTITLLMFIGKNKFYYKIKNVT